MMLVQISRVQQEDVVRVSPVFGGFGKSVVRTQSLLYRPLSVREGQVQTGESAESQWLGDNTGTLRDQILGDPAGES